MRARGAVKKKRGGRQGARRKRERGQKEITKALRGKGLEVGIESNFKLYQWE